MSGSTHVLVFPYPAQGHMLPLLDLTHQLALRNLTITILITPKNLPTLTPLLNAHPTIQTLVLPFPSHPSIPAGVENVKDLGNAGNFLIMTALHSLFDPILQWFQSHPNPPVAILSDFFLGWTVSLAQQLKIVRIAFFSSGSFLASVHDYCWSDVDYVKSMSPVQLHDLPRSPVFQEAHLPMSFRLYNKSNPYLELMKDGFIANTKSWACIFNSFQSLEGEYLDYLKTKMGHNLVYGVGPVNLIGPDPNRGGNLALDPDNLVCKWLDRCPDGSVVYVCFGSQKILNGEQMEALALGLEKSGVKFLWVVKTEMIGKVADGYESMPDGFEERVADRGLIVKGWAPQVSILNHKAVGGFISHCGWNSTLEAIVSGVMILGWPMEADQFVNAKLLVEDIGVAVRVCEGADSVPDPDDLGKVIAESFTHCAASKVRAKEFRDKALAAVKIGGSSARDLDAFVHQLKSFRGIEV